MKNIAKFIVLSVFALGIIAAGFTLMPSEAFAATTFTCNSAVLEGDFTNNSGVQTSVWFEWGPNGTFSNTTSSQNFTANGQVQIFSQSISGLAQSTVYSYRAVMQDSQGILNGQIKTFTTTSCGGGVNNPSVVTNAATSINQTGAVLNGTVNGNGSSVNAWFEYGTTQGLGNTTSQGSYGSGSTNYNYFLSNLAANTTYYYRSVAQGAGSPVYGTILSFTTTGSGGGGNNQPSVTTNNATAINQTDATLNGTVLGNGGTGNAWFEYGTTQSFGNITSPQSPYTSGSTNYSSVISNLSVGTLYYYRAVAQNAQGAPVYGQTLSFTTSAGTNSITVTTNLATNVYQASATLNGFVTKSSNSLNNVNAWFEWGTSSTFGNTTSQSYITGVSSTYSQTVSNLNSNTLYYYRAVAQNGAGAFVYGATQTFTTGTLNTNNNNGLCLINGVYQNCNNGNNNNGQCYINGYYQNCNNNSSGQPYVTTYSATGVGDTFGVLNGYVDPNGYYTTRWFEWGTTNGYLGSQTIRNTQGLTSGPFNQTLTGLQPNTTYYFRAVAQGSNGVVYGNILSFTTTGGGNTYNTGGGTNLDVVTTLATNIGYTSARINGLALINNNTATPANTNGYFEWGTDSSLNTSQSTTIQAIGSAPSVTFYASLFNLSPNTRYYYRAVATNSNGTGKGAILSFVTGSNASVNTNTSTVITTPTPRPTTTTNTSNLVIRNNLSQPSLMGLYIDRNGSCDERGDTLEFIVTYKNTSNKILKDVVLSVILPGELDFIDASRGAYSDTDRAVVNPIGIVNVSEEGVMRVRAKVSRSAQIGKTIVITADLVDTDSTTGAQEEVVAYSLNTICSNGNVNLGASLFFGSGSFLPTTLIGWLLLILLILALILITRAFYGKRESVK